MRTDVVEEFLADVKTDDNTFGIEMKTDDDPLVLELQGDVLSGDAAALRLARVAALVDEQAWLESVDFERDIAGNN